MKCPMCNGSGKCYEQKITYQEIETNRTNIYLTKCHKCDGTGEVEMTNEYFLRTATTEQLAEFLWRYTHDLIADYERIHNPMFRCMPLKNILGDNCTKKEVWMEWLKEKH